MSCGNPHEHDCSEVLALVGAFLNGRIDAQHWQDVAQHLDECGPCLGQFGDYDVDQVDHVVQAMVHRYGGCGPAPEHLRVQIVTRIRSVSIRTNGE